MPNLSALATLPLQPFESRAEHDAFCLRGGALWREQQLLVHFQLSGPLQQLRIPSQAELAKRRDGLWQSTCFEAFVGVRGQKAYWEINLCPSGHWNVYALADYRQDLRPETAVQSLPFERQQWREADEQHHLALTFALPLQVNASGLIWGPPTPQANAAMQPRAAELELSATAVLDHHHHGCSYWAWRHSGSEADFHQRSSFLLLQQSGVSEIHSEQPQRRCAPGDASHTPTRAC